MQRLRERKRKQQRLVPVEVWIPELQRDFLVKNGYDLSVAAATAIALFIKQKG
jgi:hypothetical protein